MIYSSPAMRLSAFFGPIAVLLALIPPLSGPGAQNNGDSLEQQEYETCMRLTRVDPAQAFEHSLAWRDRGGGPAAQHCSAVALIMLGHEAEAAERLESLATGMPDDTPPEAVAEILAQAGLAWLDAGDASRARAVQSAALELAPKNPDILIDRATAYFATANYWEAIDDLNLALEIARERADAFALRASAYRHVDVFDLALEDADRALELDPQHPEALLERGALHRLLGNPDAARQDWLLLIRLHDGRPAADHARRNLELLDLETPE